VYFFDALTKSIHTASFFEIDPWFSVGGQTYPLAMMGDARDSYLPGYNSMLATKPMYFLFFLQPVFLRWNHLSVCLC